MWHHKKKSQYIFEVLRRKKKETFFFWFPILFSALKPSSQMYNFLAHKFQDKPPKHTCKVHET